MHALEMNVGPTDIDATARNAVAVVASYIGRSGKYRQLFQPGRSCPYSCHNPFHMQFFFLVGPLFLWRATVFFFTLFIHSNTSIWMVDAAGSSFMHYYCYTIYLNKSNKHQPVGLKKIRVWVCAVQTVCIYKMHCIHMDCCFEITWWELFGIYPCLSIYGQVCFGWWNGYQTISCIHVPMNSSRP